MNEKRKQSKDMPRVKPRHFRCLIPYLFVKIYIFFFLEFKDFVSTRA